MTTHTTMLSCVTRYNLITFRWHKYNNINVSIVRSLLVSGWVTRKVLRMACIACVHFFPSHPLPLLLLFAHPLPLLLFAHPSPFSFLLTPTPFSFFLPTPHLILFAHPLTLLLLFCSPFPLLPIFSSPQVHSFAHSVASCPCLENGKETFATQAILRGDGN